MMVFEVFHSQKEKFSIFYGNNILLHNLSINNLDTKWTTNTCVSISTYYFID